MGIPVKTLRITPPETNIFAENGWLEYFSPFLLGPGPFSRAFAVGSREGNFLSGHFFNSEGRNTHRIGVFTPQLMNFNRVGTMIFTIHFGG